MLTYTPTTALEAVNTMLGAIGEAPVSSLDVSGNADVAIANSILHEVSRSVQRDGWHFNTDEDYPMNPDVDGYVFLPNNTMRVDSSARNATLNVVVRGNRLYDKENHTYEFDQTVYTDITWFFPFEDLPEDARYYITIRAARIFVQRNSGDANDHVYTYEDERKALAQLEAAEIANSDCNMLRDSNSIARILRR